MTEDEVVGWHHCLDGHEFERTLGDSEGQESLAWRVFMELGIQLGERDGGQRLAQVE